jgi:hypothetical protein
MALIPPTIDDRVAHDVSGANEVCEGLGRLFGIGTLFDPLRVAKVHLDHKDRL